jgi:hypothetical protein
MLGNIAMARIYNRPLTSAEVTQNYNSISKAYPPAALTAASTTLSSQTYGNGTYVVSQSSGTAYLTFNKNLADYWQGRAGDQGGQVYDNGAAWQNNAGADGGTGNVCTVSGATAYATTSPWNTFTSVNSAYYGDWVQLQMPQAIRLTTYTITGRNGFASMTPQNWVILASNNGSSWTLIDTQVTTTTWTNNTAYSFTPSFPGGVAAYSYYAIVITRIGSGTAHSQYGCASMAEMVFNGY